MRVEYPSAVAPDATKPASTTWLAQIWEHRGLVRLLVVRDLKVRYKRSVLGFLWTLLNPLLTIL
ncbi:MAG TPA: hypothetical protein VJX67_26400, partial [Blastocatellia bacterium]|nr:hypothetical protein [Blastocatellia bacterium]